MDQSKDYLHYQMHNYSVRIKISKQY